MKRIYLMIFALGLLLPASASATFPGRNGRIAWAVWNAGGGGGGGFASLTSFPLAGGHGKQLGYCPEDDNGNVCQNWYDVAYSADGQQLVWDQPGPRQNRVIVLAGPSANNPLVIDHEAAADWEPSFSPDGRRIVYMREPPRGTGHWGKLVISDLAGSKPRLITRAVTGAYPEFTPDGQRVAFVRAGGGIWSVGTDGTRLRHLIRGAKQFDLSPDGHLIAYVSHRGDLYVAQLDGTRAHRAARADASDEPIDAVRFSPDGRLLAFTKPAAPSGRVQGETLYTVPARGGRVEVISSSGDYRTQTTGLAWQPLVPRAVRISSPAAGRTASGSFAAPASP